MRMFHSNHLNWYWICDYHKAPSSLTHISSLLNTVWCICYICVLDRHENQFDNPMKMMKICVLSHWYIQLFLFRTILNSILGWYGEKKRKFQDNKNKLHRHEDYSLWRSFACSLSVRQYGNERCYDYYLSFWR